MIETMSGDATPRLRLPLLHAGQAQKELDHNEALALLDFAVQPAVMAMGLDAPPPQPGEGECWIVGAHPTGEWSGRALSLAGWTANGWRFLDPRNGMTVWRTEDGLMARYTEGSWRIGEVHASKVLIEGNAMLTAPQPPIADTAGGATIDREAREAIEAVLETLRVHGLIRT
ncbi:DUF2793 domain-containing protein [Sphingomonas mucosissima]|uniref:DUF2793 domain-containing protein n=1 Tax=Sphingomonas mucosissima TaxID=370959 RepID=A0A245ZD67_9SPHN|nr:DUF2793 domain-containing protein [Sphingomonas mucosissima]OWK27644.1 hypothetical protein SPMU_33700 [Sphingomonas mucosissima]